MDMFAWVKGCKPHVQKWENDLMAMWVPVYKDGKPIVDENGEKTFMQIAVEPINLYTIRFPEEELENVLAVCGIEKNHKNGSYLLDRYPVLRNATKILRKFLKLKPVPEPKFVNNLAQPNNLFKAVAVNPIGLKKERFVDGVELL